MIGHVYKRGSRWWWKVVLKGRTFRGSCGPLVDSRAEAQIVLAEQIATLGRAHQLPEDVTVEQAVDSWEVSSAAPVASQCSRVRRILDPHLEKPLARFGVPQLKDYWRVRIRQVKQATLQRELNDLSSFFRWACLNGYAESNPVRQLEKPKLAGSPKKPALERAEVAQALDIVKDDERLSLAYHLAFYVGLRRSAIVAARWEWVDWQSGELQMQVGKTQNSIGRFALHEKLLRVLRKYKRDSGPIIRSTRYPGRGVSAGYLETLRVRWMREHKERLPNWHQARHTLGTFLILKDGISVLEVSRLLGHASVTTTERYYADLKRVATRRAVDAIDY